VHSNPGGRGVDRKALLSARVITRTSLPSRKKRKKGNSFHVPIQAREDKEQPHSASMNLERRKGTKITLVS